MFSFSIYRDQLGRGMNKQIGIAWLQGLFVGQVSLTKESMFSFILLSLWTDANYYWFDVEPT